MIFKLQIGHICKFLPLLYILNSFGDHLLQPSIAVHFFLVLSSIHLFVLGNWKYLDNCSSRCSHDNYLWHNRDLNFKFQLCWMVLGMYHKMSSFINSEIPCPICLQLYVEKNKSAEGQGKVLSFILTVKSLWS